MALRDVSEFHAWIEREQPSIQARRVARTFIAELGDRPWTAPSVPIEELSRHNQRRPHRHHTTLTDIPCRTANES